MAKKKKGKKKATRKTAPKKKKAASRKTSRKAGKPKARKPVRKAKRKPVTPKKPKPVPAPAQAAPLVVPFAVNVRGCDINPPSQNFPPYGNVDFDCSDDCELVFSNPEIFGFPSDHQPMHRGNNRHRLIVAEGHSEFSIDGCADRVGPADIIVP